MDPQKSLNGLIKNQKALLEKKAALCTNQVVLFDKIKAEKRLFTAEEKAQFDGWQAEIEPLNTEIEALKISIKNIEEQILGELGLAAIDARLNAPAAAGPRVDVKPVDKVFKVFKNLTAQLKAVKDVAVTGHVDENLMKVNNALGMNTGTAQEGGFAIQQDFAGMMLESAVEDDPILSKIDTYEISQQSDSVKWIDLDESDVSTTVFGGVRAYWASEATTVEATKPKLAEKELKLAKLMGFAYSTYELDADSTFTDQLYTRAFQLAIRRELASAIMSGDGVGKPLGVLKAGSLVTIDKETKQEGATVVWENISGMYHRALNRDEGNFAWIMHPDVHEQLDFLALRVGLGGVPVYLQATAVGSQDTLRGKPILESDQCSALGTKGDINFMDLSKYMLIYKGGVDQAVSIHVQFLTAENCFRFIFRANGLPKKNKAIKLKNTANYRSAFITLADRA
jgi:HK97 family phage major capsid protein